MDTTIPMIAGAVSTMVFATSMLPMLLKAVRTRDLRSYSPAMLLLTNAGNAIHSLYVFSLPVGPIWALHAFHMISTALMLVWYLRFEWLPSRSDQRRPGGQRDNRVVLGTLSNAAGGFGRREV